MSSTTRRLRRCRLCWPWARSRSCCLRSGCLGFRVMSEPNFLRLDALTLAYGATVAAPSLELSLAEGELVALLGPSGCGKTTTMRAIAGLLVPRSGRIHLAGRDITNVPANKRGVGLVFQSYA